MLRLALVRHAKSDWGSPDLDDHDRPLNSRGMRDAPVMARRVAETGFRPDVIVSSTALRARTTAEVFGSELGVAVDLEESLYGAPPRTLLAVAAATRARTVMLVGHDPGLSDLAAALSDERVSHMPTCAVATFTWTDAEWDTVDAIPADEWTFDSPRGG